MSYSVFKNNAITLDLMVEKKFQPKLVGYFQAYQCSYDKEEELENGFVVLRNVSSVHHQEMGSLLRAFFNLEQETMCAGKFYILVNFKKKEKKNHVQENRSQSGSGSESGNSGESTGNSGSEQDPGPGGDSYQPVSVSARDIREIEIPEGAAASDDCE